jgi:hypothetical protein
MQIEKLVNKESVTHYGATPQRWYEVTFENGTKGAYELKESSELFSKQVLTLVSCDTLLKYANVSDYFYTIQDILHKHDEFKEVPTSNSHHQLFVKPNNKLKLQIHNKGE